MGDPVDDTNPDPNNPDAGHGNPPPKNPKREGVSAPQEDESK